MSLDGSTWGDLQRRDRDARERRKRRVADGGKSNLRLLLVTRSSLFYFLALEK